MATVLIAVIYAAFIGLGLPDSLFGTAWPSIYREFGLPIAFGSLESAICFLGTILSSLLSARLIRRFGTARLTAGCTLLTAVSLVGYGWAGSFPVMLALAVPLGLGAGSVDTALNNYVALHYSASRMSFLHCFYGVGVTVSPFILAMVKTRSITPTVDAVPVTRCKDCGNRECDGRAGTVVCGITGESHSRLWFCADGEKKGR